MTAKSTKMSTKAFLAMIAMAMSAVVAAGQSTDATQQAESGINQQVGGVRQGKWRIEGRNGTVDEGSYVNGKKHGLWRTTTSDGTVRSEVTFANGIADGKATYYYPDGTVMERGTWRIDHWEGDYERFYPNGGKACTFKYDSNGRRAGRQTYYHQNGNMMFDGNWTDGRINGTLTVYNEKGLKVMERNYDASGKYQGSQELDEPVAAPQPKEFKGTGDFTIFDNRGRREKSGRFVNGKLVDGEIYSYGDDGKLKQTEIVKGGKVTGTKKR